MYKKKTDKWDLTKEIIKRVKRKAPDWEKIVALYIFNKVLDSQYTKNSYKLIEKDNPFFLKSKRV